MKNIADFYPLSPMQQGMLFHSRLAPESGMYVEQLSCLLKGSLDAAALARAWQRVVDRHPILRTGFVSEGLKEPVQAVHKQVQITLDEQDWTGLSPDEQERRLEAFLEEDRRKGFNLSKPPLIRVALLRMQEDAWRLVWTHHHILLDGWSTPIVLQEVFIFYEAFRLGKEPALDLPAPYRNYIAWLRRQNTAAAEAFWRKSLDGITAPTPLIEDTVPEDQLPEGDTFRDLENWLPADLTRSLQSLARQHRVTLSTVVLAAWSILLSRYSGEEDVITGMTVSGRPADLAGVEQMVGLFINTLPVRARVDPNLTAGEFLQALQKQLIEMQQFEYSPLVQVQGWSSIPRGLPLFETLYVFENYPIQQTVGSMQSSLAIEDIRSSEKTNFPLNLIAGASDRLMLRIGYDAAKFQPATIERMLNHLENLLRGMAAAPDRPLHALPLVTGDERRRLLVDWNNNPIPIEIDLSKTVIDLIGEQAQRTPDAAALAYGGQTVTYREMEIRSNQIARALIERGIRPGDLVGLSLEGFDLVYSILGIMKAGAAYLPLDPTYPFDRLDYMVTDSGIGCLLTHSRHLDALPVPPGGVICLDQEWEAVARLPQDAPCVKVSPDDLAYVIYTSGSTGRPKGSLLKHRGLSNLSQAGAYLLQLKPGSRSLEFFSISFDASVWIFFTALVSGACVVLPKRENLASPAELVKFINQERITHFFMTPSILAFIHPEETPTVTAAITGGESCPPDLTELWSSRCLFINAYGPTEATIVSTLHLAAPGTPVGPRTPIGKAIPNCRAYILDKQLQPVPVGVPGELHVGGVNLSVGYLNRPDLTAEKFIADPFVPGEKIYKTGDLARWLPDGTIDFLGRIDDQVKIRGFRIELGEIEAVLARHESVKAAVVAAMPDPGADDSQAKQLVAYAVLEPSASLTLGEVRDFLSQSLPDYMLPSALVILDEIPLNRSGKADRKALPMPQRDRAAAAAELIPPRDELEAHLCQIWEEVLGVHPIGVADNFFELGGHSLLAMRMVGVIKEKLGADVDLTALFEEPTIERLADELRKTAAPEISVHAGIDVETAGKAEEDRKTGKSVLVTLQGKGSKTPLFFVHPSGGSTHWYKDLSNALGKDQPFYAFQAVGFRGDQPLHTTIEEMASCYIEAMRSVQPHGPYQIGSWSLGVIIAYEMAQQLAAAGEEVAALIMLDQGPEMPLSPPEDDAEYLVQTFGSRIPLEVEELRGRDFHDQIAYVLEKGKKKRFIMPFVTQKAFTHFITILRTQGNAWRNYTVRPYPGQVTLFRALEQPDGAPAEPDMGWGRVAQGGVKIIETPGDHLTMIHKPLAKDLAERMKTILQ